MVGKILIPEIKSLIEARDFNTLREIFCEFPPADLAEIIPRSSGRRSGHHLSRVAGGAGGGRFRISRRRGAGKTCCAPWRTNRSPAILNEMSPDDRTALLEELPSAAARQLIKLLTPEERRVAQALLGYPEGSVGRLMTPDFVAVHDDWTVKEVLDYVREHGQRQRDAQCHLRRR